MTGNLFRNPTKQRENRSQAYATRTRSDVGHIMASRLSRLYRTSATTSKAGRPIPMDTNNTSMTRTGDNQWLENAAAPMPTAEMTAVPKDTNLASETA